MLDVNDFEAAVAAHTYFPITTREDIKLHEFFKKVDENEVVEEEEEDVGAWMSSKEEEADGDVGKDCFGVDME
eukprot:scaffold120451_cov14-Tisochrysis_lutea.AAC.1